MDPAPVRGLSLSSCLLFASMPHSVPVRGSLVKSAISAKLVGPIDVNAPLDWLIENSGVVGGKTTPQRSDAHPFLIRDNEYHRDYEAPFHGASLSGVSAGIAQPGRMEPGGKLTRRKLFS